jgi:hypothetical protein
MIVSLYILFNSSFTIKIYELYILENFIKQTKNNVMHFNTDYEACSNETRSQIVPVEGVDTIMNSPLSH